MPCQETRGVNWIIAGWQPKSLRQAAAVLSGWNCIYMLVGWFVWCTTETLKVCGVVLPFNVVRQFNIVILYWKHNVQIHCKGPTVITPHVKGLFDNENDLFHQLQHCQDGQTVFKRKQLWMMNPLFNIWHTASEKPTEPDVVREPPKPQQHFSAFYSFTDKSFLSFLGALVTFFVWNDSPDSLTGQ